MVGMWMTACQVVTVRSTRAIADLRKTFPFKHWKSRKGRFCGSELNQNSDFSITASQKEFSDQLSYAKSRNRAKPEDAANHDEIRELMGLNGSTNWLSKESRPDLACHANQNQQCLPNPTVGQIRNANALVRRAKQFSFISLFMKFACIAC